MIRGIIIAPLVLLGLMWMTSADASVILSCGPTQGRLESMGDYLVACKKLTDQSYVYRQGQCQMPFRYLVDFGNGVYKCAPAPSAKNSGSVPYRCSTSLGYQPNRSARNKNQTCQKLVKTYQYTQPILRAK